MPVCSTGISQPKSGVPSSLVVDNAYIQSLLPAGLAWLYPYLPFMHGLSIGDVGAFCGADPPTWTLPSGADIFAFVTGGAIAQVVVVNQFLVDITRAYLWYNICECASVATPAPPSAPAAPSDLPSINPPGVVGTPAGPCGTNAASVSIVTGTGAKEVFDDQLCGFGAHPACNTFGIPVPPGATSYEVVKTINLSGGTSSGGTGAYVIADSSNTFLSGDAFTTALRGSPTEWPYVLTSGRQPVPAGADHFLVSHPDGADAGTQSVNASVTWYCGSGVVAPPGGGSSCCTSTDPLTLGQLSIILQTLTLIQRQIAPFAYVTGAVHAGLTGSGTVSVQGILGLLANISAPSSTGLIAGEPDVLIPMGRVNLATADGYIDRHQLVVESQIILPALAGIFTSVGYSLEPGVTMTLTELIREP